MSVTEFTGQDNDGLAVFPERGAALGAGELLQAPAHHGADVRDGPVILLRKLQRLLALLVADETDAFEDLDHIIVIRVQRSISAGPMTPSP